MGTVVKCFQPRKTSYNFAGTFSSVPVVRGFGALVTYECQQSSGEPADECLQVNMGEAEGIHPKASLRTQEERRENYLPLNYSWACRESLKYSFLHCSDTTDPGGTRFVTQVCRTNVFVQTLAALRGTG